MNVNLASKCARTWISPRRLVVGIAGTLLVGLPMTVNATPAPTPPPAPTTPAPTTPARITSTPTHVSVSADGSTAVYSTVDDAGDTTVMLATTTADTDADTDADTGPTPLVSVGEGRRGGDTVLPVISGDGCVVVAVTQIAFDLFRDDDRDARWDVYRLVLPACGGRENNWELVSTDDRGIATDSVSDLVTPAVSASGSTVAYTSGGDPDLSSVHVVDLTEPITVPRTRTVPQPDGAPTKPYRYNGVDQPALSGDGTRLAFRSDIDPTGDVPEWNTGPIRGGDAAAQIYVWDLDADALRIELVSQRGEQPAEHGASEPAISADGSTVAFVANDADLDPTVGWSCDPHCADQVLVSRHADGWGAPLVASASPLGQPVAGAADVPMTTGDRRSWSPELSGDGTMVAFLSHATNLTAHAARPSSHPRAGDLLIARPSPEPSGERDGSQDVADGGAADGPRTADPPIPVDAATPRWSDHTGFAMSASFATAVFDVGRASVDHIIAEPDGRFLVSTTTEVDLTMADIGFGTVLEGLESDEHFTVLRNAGPVGFASASVDVDSDEFKVTGGTCTTAIVVPPGGTCTVYVTFTPNGGGSEAVLTVDSPEGQQATATVYGRSGAPGLRLDPNGVDFGSVRVETDAERERVSVVNYSYDAITISGVTVGGTDADSFSVDDDRCTGVVIDAGESCAMSIGFSPRSAGDLWAVLQVESIDGPATAATLAGSGSRSPSLTVAVVDDTLVIDGTGFAPETPIMVSIVGERDVLSTVTDGNGVVHVAELPTRAGPDITVAARTEDGAWALARTTLEVRPSTPTFLPGYGVG